MEQVELAGGQHELFAIGAAHAPLGRLQHPAAEKKRIFSCPMRAIMLDSRGAPASEHTAYTRQNLAQMKRFDDIIVGTHLEPRYAVDDIGAAGDDHNADLRHGSNFTQQREAVLSRQTQVQKHQINIELTETGAHLIAVSRFADSKSLTCEVSAEHILNTCIVFDDQDVPARRFLHAIPHHTFFVLSSLKITHAQA